MKRKLSLDKTWAECLEMWNWITKHMAANPDIVNPDHLKDIWMRDHYSRQYVEHNCLFCEYCKQHDGDAYPNYGVNTAECCDACPGKLVDPDFNCEESGQSWNDNPFNFYERLKKLNRRRLSQKRRK